MDNTNQNAPDKLTPDYGAIKCYIDLILH